MDSEENTATTDPQTAKLRLLYRIPDTPVRGRALELSVDGRSVFGDSAWAGEVAVTCDGGPTHLASLAPAKRPPRVGHAVHCVADPTKEFPFPDDYFDLVILHRTLDHLAASLARRRHDAMIDDMLIRIRKVISPGGIVAGCVENRHCLATLLSDMKYAPRPRKAAVALDSIDSRPPMSVLSCRAALERAGFEAIEIFGILPHLDAPRSFLSIERGWSRRACIRQIEALRPMILPSSYLAWRVLAELGISQYLGRALFFWARKAC